MQFSENWLRSLVDIPASQTELLHRLTMAGLEVEAAEPVAPPFSGVVVGKILDCAHHPDAERLQVCRVEVGDAAPRTIVCGAPNAASGLTVPCALPGAKLPGMEIRVAKVRGVESHGMLCAAGELGLDLPGDGLLVLPDSLEAGQDLRAALDLDDARLTLKLTPNRADCLSMKGLARELAAMMQTRIGAIDLPDPPVLLDALPAVRVEATEACPRYLARIVRGIDPTAQPPWWMAERLRRSGIRPHSAAVDVTNYVLLELGQPMHAFDLARIRGGITVRYAQDGETLDLLNGSTVRLSPDMLVVADEAAPLALAGIMGGAASAVSDATTSVLLEAAFFAPAAIAGRARRLGLATDSSHRFERGVDFAAPHEAMARATALLLEICGGSAGPVTEVRHALPERAAIPLRLSRIARVAGVHVDASRVVMHLTALGCTVAHRDTDTLLVTPPSYRFDLGIEADMIEEVIRLEGYDQVPARVPQGALRMLSTPETRLPDERLRTRLATLDYQEVITYSFVDPAWEAALAPGMDPIELANPLAAQLSVMRTTLWGGLVHTLRHNLNRQQSRVRLFEIGRIYQSPDIQPERLAGLAYGSSAPEQWGSRPAGVDFFDVKGDLERLCAGRSLETRVASHPALHPGQCAQVLLDGEAIGLIGSLHPALVKRFDLPGAPVLFELELDALLVQPCPRHQPISRFPQVRRDLAFVLDAHTPAAELLAVLRAAAPALVSRIEVFDTYRGKGMADDEKSLAIRVLIQDTERTLTDHEVDEAIARLVHVAAQECNARLRA